MIYRAYDIRGKVGREQNVNPEIAEKIGAAFGTDIIQRGLGERVIVGRDNRHSSEDLAEALMRGVRSTGLPTVFIGEVATPILYHASLMYSDMDSPAVMVTGSHLPPDQNGFKMTVGLNPFFGDDIQRLREMVEAEDFIVADEAGEAVEVPEYASRYMMDMMERFSQPEKPLKIVVDAGNGMASLFAPTILHRLGHEVIRLHCESDGSYPNHPADPNEEKNLTDLKAAIHNHGADLGLAFDGDADRVGFVDHEGNSHPTDRAMIPLVRDILLKHVDDGLNTIITDSLVSKVLEESIQMVGGTALMWKSGHSNIKMKMKEVDTPLAIETSGHVFIADDFYGFDDGIYTALRMVELLSRQNSAAFADIMGAIPKLHTTPQFRPKCPEAIKQQVIDAIAEAYAEYPQVTVDGVRVTLPQGWFIVRASNTEERLSLRFEADDDVELDRMVWKIEQLLLKYNVILR